MRCSPSLPTGLSLNSTSGVISGTPTSANTFGFTITATDGVAATGSRSYSVTINPALAITTTVLANGTQGTAYSQTIVTSGGTAPIGPKIPVAVFGNTAVGQDLFYEVGGFRPEFSGAQDYDLALRLSTRAQSIHHVQYGL